MMNTVRILRRTAAVTAALLLAACAANGPTVSGNWKDIGTTSNGNIKASIDMDSIKKNGHVVTFRDKKTVLKPNEERYTNLPKYKTAVGEWEINCQNKTYRLTALKLLNSNGSTLTDERYTAVNLRPMSITLGSITAKQYETVCKRKL